MSYFKHAATQKTLSILPSTDTVKGLCYLLELSLPIQTNTWNPDPNLPETLGTVQLGTFLTALKTKMSHYLNDISPPHIFFDGSVVQKLHKLKHTPQGLQPAITDIDILILMPHTHWAVVSTRLHEALTDTLLEILQFPHSKSLVSHLYQHKNAMIQDPDTQNVMGYLYSFGSRTETENGIKVDLKFIMIGDNEPLASPLLQKCCTHYGDASMVGPLNRLLEYKIPEHKTDLIRLLKQLHNTPIPLTISSKIPMEAQEAKLINTHKWHIGPCVPNPFPTFKWIKKTEHWIMPHYLYLILSALQKMSLPQFQKNLGIYFKNHCITKEEKIDYAKKLFTLLDESKNHPEEHMVGLEEKKNHLLDLVPDIPINFHYDIHRRCLSQWHNAIQRYQESGCENTLSYKELVRSLTIYMAIRIAPEHGIDTHLETTYPNLADCFTAIDHMACHTRLTQKPLLPKEIHIKLPNSILSAQTPPLENPIWKTHAQEWIDHILHNPLSDYIPLYWQLQRWTKNTIETWCMHLNAIKDLSKLSEKEKKLWLESYALHLLGTKELHACELLSNLTFTNVDTCLDLVKQIPLNEKNWPFFEKTEACHPSNTFLNYTLTRNCHTSGIAKYQDLAYVRLEQRLVGDTGPLGMEDISLIATLYGIEKQPPNTLIHTLEKRYPGGLKGQLNGKTDPISIYEDTLALFNTPSLFPLGCLLGERLIKQKNCPLTLGLHLLSHTLEARSENKAIQKAQINTLKNFVTRYEKEKDPHLKKNCLESLLRILSTTEETWTIPFLGSMMDKLIFPDMHLSNKTQMQIVALILKYTALPLDDISHQTRWRQFELFAPQISGKNLKETYLNSVFNHVFSSAYGEDDVEKMGVLLTETLFPKYAQDDTYSLCIFSRLGKAFVLLRCSRYEQSHASGYPVFSEKVYKLFFYFQQHKVYVGILGILMAQLCMTHPYCLHDFVTCLKMFTLLSEGKTETIPSKIRQLLAKTVHTFIKDMALPLNYFLAKNTDVGVFEENTRMLSRIYWPHFSYLIQTNPDYICPDTSMRQWVTESIRPENLNHDIYITPTNQFPNAYAHIQENPNASNIWQLEDYPHHSVTNLTSVTPFFSAMRSGFIRQECLYAYGVYALKSLLETASNDWHTIHNAPTETGTPTKQDIFRITVLNIVQKMVFTLCTEHKKEHQGKLALKQLGLPHIVLLETVLPSFETLLTKMISYQKTPSNLGRALYCLLYQLGNTPRRKQFMAYLTEVLPQSPATTAALIQYAYLFQAGYSEILATFTNIPSIETVNEEESLFDAYTQALSLIKTEEF